MWRHATTTHDDRQHVFTGTFEVYGNDTRPRHLEGVEGFDEVRLADNGTASVLAIDT